MNSNYRANQHKEVGSLKLNTYLTADSRFML
jgi:hypothetical protein